MGADTAGKRRRTDRGSRAFSAGSLETGKGRHMNFDQYTERARGFVQSAQTGALAAGNQQFTPEHIRPYSMAGLPGDEEWEFQIRRVFDGRVTEHVFEQLKPGAALRIADCEPFGGGKRRGGIERIATPTGGEPALARAIAAAREIVGQRHG